MNRNSLSVALTLLLLAWATFVVLGCSIQPTQNPEHPAGDAASLVTGVDHILFTVADLDRSVKFYRDVLGLTVAHKSSHFVWLKAGDFGVALSDKPWSFEKKGEPRGVGMIPHFTVRDMDALAATLKERHVPWLREPKDEGWGIEAFVADPDGYQWVFVAPSRQRAASR